MKTSSCILAILVLTIGLTIPVASPAEEGTTFIQLSLVPPVQLFDRTYAVHGFRLNLIAGENREVSGFDLGFVNYVKGDFKGYGLGLVNIAGGKMSGFQEGPLAKADGLMTGLQLGVLTWADQNGTGVQGLGFNYCREEIEGMQVGLVNIAGSLHGFQLGLVNKTVGLRGIQIGLLNIATGKEKWRYLPIVNASF